MKFRKYDQAQTKFINLDYRKILGEESDAVMINDIVDVLDLSIIEDKYVEVGNLAYHPRMMIKILIYGYYKSYFGGRPLHRNYEADLGLRFLSNDDFPDHRTINLFRIHFKDEIAEIFSQVVMLCKELGMIGFDNLAIDGQKLRASANMLQNKNLKEVREEMEKIKIQLAKLLEKETNFVDLSDVQKATKKKKTKLERRRKKLEKAAQVLKDAGVQNDDMRYNLSDPDSRIMVDKRGVANPDYNTQNAVDDRFQVLTAVDVINYQNDNEQLLPMMTKSKLNSGEYHKNTIADSGYSDKKTYGIMEDDENTDYYVPDKTMRSSNKNPYSKWNFKYDASRDVYECPQGEELFFVRISKDVRGLNYRHYEGKSCSKCKERKKCLQRKKGKKGDGDKSYNRRIIIYPEDEQVKRMREKLESDEGKKIYQRRMCTVEPVHGEIQKNRRFTQFSLRGLEKVRGEYHLVGIAHNIRKILLHAADAFKKYFKGMKVGSNGYLVRT